jgi:hypothetical protein
MLHIHLIIYSLKAIFIPYFKVFCAGNKVSRYGIFYIWHCIGPQKVSDLGVFWIFDCQIRASQPIASAYKGVEQLELYTLESHKGVLLHLPYYYAFHRIVFILPKNIKKSVHSTIIKNSQNI